MGVWGEVWCGWRGKKMGEMETERNSVLRDRRIQRKDEERKKVRKAADGSGRTCE